MLGEAIKRLRDKTLKIKKSDLDPSASSEGADQGSSGAPAAPGTGASQEDVASQAVTYFETGELSPDLEAVKAFALEKGIPESEVESFAQDVIDAYFGADAGTGGLGEPTPEADANSPLPEEGMNNEEIQKSLLSIQNSQSVLAEALETVLSKQAKVDMLMDEVVKLKSMLGKLQTQPANPKNPVEKQSVSKSTLVVGGVPVQEKADVELAILKGIKAGELAIEEMTYFESTGRVSESAQVIVSKYRGGK